MQEYFKIKNRIKGESNRKLLYEIFDVKMDNGKSEWLGNSYISSKRDFESILLFMFDKYADIEGHDNAIKYLEMIKDYYEKIKSGQDQK